MSLSSAVMSVRVGFVLVHVKRIIIELKIYTRDFKEYYFQTKITSSQGLTISQVYIKNIYFNFYLVYIDIIDRKLDLRYYSVKLR